MPSLQPLVSASVNSNVSLYYCLQYLILKCPIFFQLLQSILETAVKTSSELWRCTKWEISSSIMTTDGQYLVALKHLQPFAHLHSKSRDVFPYSPDLDRVCVFRAAHSYWSKAVDCALQSSRAIEKWDGSSIGGSSMEKTFKQAGIWGCLHAASLIAKTAQWALSCCCLLCISQDFLNTFFLCFLCIFVIRYTLTSDINQRTKCCLLSAHLFKVRGSSMCSFISTSTRDTLNRVFCVPVCRRATCVFCFSRVCCDAPWLSLWPIFSLLTTALEENCYPALIFSLNHTGFTWAPRYPAWSSSATGCSLKASIRRYSQALTPCSWSRWSTKFRWNYIKSLVMSAPTYASSLPASRWDRVQRCGTHCWGQNTQGEYFTVYKGLKACPIVW